MADAEYTGYKIVAPTDEELAYFYENINTNMFECLINEYIVIKDKSGDVIDTRRWDGNSYIPVYPKVISTKYCGVTASRNIQQTLAIDMLRNENITVKMLSGRYGTGKDFLMCLTAIELLEKGKVDKIVYVRNNIEVKDSKPIGYLPGSNDEKLMPYAMVLADKLGGRDALDMFIGQGKIEIAHLGFIRGRDIKNSIVYCSEAENMTKEHIQLLLGRIGEGSSLWINGDCRQTDLNVFSKNSGMKCAIDRLKGHPMFGYIQLMKTERSETAALADLLD